MKYYKFSLQNSQCPKILNIQAWISWFYLLSRSHFFFCGKKVQGNLRYCIIGGWFLWEKGSIAWSIEQHFTGQKVDGICANEWKEMRVHYNLVNRGESKLMGWEKKRGERVGVWWGQKKILRGYVYLILLCNKIDVDHFFSFWILG